MDYEKKYKDILTRLEEAKNDNEVCDERYCCVINDIIPELKESEDERIRRTLIDFFQDWHKTRSHCWSVPVPDILAWLEKQGELSICNIPSREVILAIWDLGNEWKELTNGCISTEYGTQLKYIQKHWQESEYYLRAMQDKQNHVDTVEPKFKVGDWVVSDVAHEDYRICKILSDNDGEYIIESIYGYRGHNSFETFDKDYRLWGIQDAKDGDVLYINNTMSESIMIYKSFNNGVINKHASYNKFGFEGENYLTLNDGYIIPATKEQRDLLFQKMHEAGYKWDAEKKEVKKIEPFDRYGMAG